MTWPCAASAASASTRRAVATTWWPASASMIAVSRPIPELAPVTRMVDIAVEISHTMSYVKRRIMARKKIVPRDVSAAATREALIAAGLAAFDRDGLDASLDAICARAKLTRGAFYVHFADRDAFIVAVMRHVIGTFVSGLALLPSGDTGGIARAIELFVAAADARAPAVTGGSGLRLQHLLEACRRSATIGGAYRELLVGARDRLADAIAVDQAASPARVRRDVDARALADLMIVTALGFAARHELELELDVAAAARALLALLRRA